MITEFSLTGRTAIVTGAGRGIGTGIAEVLAEAGADVAVNALTGKYLDPFVKDLARRSGRRIVGITGDCTTAIGAARLVEQAAAELGPIDILVNNLGDAIRKPMKDMTDEEIDRSWG
jgi:NAD(P)-dependent dehydrogenase (short-subunit alcohol dehydrogenase family)